MGVTIRKPEPADAFHAHLEACKQCREQPFNLCAVGTPLLKLAAEEGAQIKWPPLDEEGFPF